MFLIVLKIAHDHTLLFLRFHIVTHIDFDTIITWMRIVNHSLVEIDGKVHCHGIPSRILVVYKKEIPVIC